MGLTPRLRSQLPSILQAAEQAEPQLPKVRGKPRLRLLSIEESLARLDTFTDEGKAGAPDDWLARNANVNLSAIRRWRRLRNIKRAPGSRRKEELATWALDAFGDAYDAPLHAVGSQLHGLWELPEFVLRHPLNYDALCRLSWELYSTCGHSAETIADAFGIREKDINMALEIQAAHLEQLNVSCPRCGKAMDPAGGTLCSKSCR